MSGIDISDGYMMTTNPSVVHELSYEYKRVGNHVYYRFKIITEPMTENFFAFDLLMDLTLNSKKVVSGGMIKNTAPSKWESAVITYFPSKTGWYEVKNVTAQKALPCECLFYSSQTAGSASSFDGMVYVPPSESKESKIYLKINHTWKTSKKFHVKVNGAWKKAKKIWIKVNGIWKEV